MFLFVDFLAVNDHKDFWISSCHASEELMIWVCRVFSGLCDNCLSCRGSMGRFFEEIIWRKAITFVFIKDCGVQQELWF